MTRRIGLVEAKSTEQQLAGLPKDGILIPVNWRSSAFRSVVRLAQKFDGHMHVALDQGRDKPYLPMPNGKWSRTHQDVREGQGRGKRSYPFHLPVAGVIVYSA